MHGENANCPILVVHLFHRYQDPSLLIGLKSNGSHHNWLDGSALQLDNWDGYKKDHSYPVVLRLFGKYRHESNQPRPLLCEMPAAIDPSTKKGKVMSSILSFRSGKSPWEERRNYFSHIYSADILFFHLLTGRLVVPGCTSTHGFYVQQQVMHMNDPCSLRIKATFSCEVRGLWSHPHPGDWMAINLAVMYYAHTANTFRAGIKCRHCNLQKLEKEER